MTKARTFLAVIVMLLLTIGYAASQYAYFTNTIVEYSQRVDTPAISHLALVFFLAIVVFGLLREREAEDS